MLIRSIYRVTAAMIGCWSASRAPIRQMLRISASWASGMDDYVTLVFRTGQYIVIGKPAMEAAKAAIGDDAVVEVVNDDEQIYRVYAANVGPFEIQ
jgi:hypothetical protein